MPPFLGVGGWGGGGGWKEVERAYNCSCVHACVANIMAEVVMFQQEREKQFISQSL